MATTLLAKKADGSTPLATSDDHHDAMAADPTVTAFPQGSTFGSVSSTTTTSTTTSTSSFGDVGNVSPASFGALGQSPTIPNNQTSTTVTNSFGSTPLGGGFGSSTNTGFGSTGQSNGATVMPTNQTSNLQVVQNQGEAIKSSGGAMQEGAENQVALDKDATDWINKKWRPVMGWVYMLTCTCDFVVFPILWSLLQALSHGSVTSQWQPLTLQGAGLYHIAMGAVLGIAAYGRTKEKIAEKA